MRDLNDKLKQHIDSEVTTMASCWYIKRKDGLELGFTDHDQMISINGMEYESIAGFNPTNIETSNNLAVDNLEINGQVTDSKITAKDLLAGKYDFAHLEIFLVNYNKPNDGKLIQKSGIIGEVTLKNKLFYAEIRGLSQFLSQTLCEDYSPHCRAKLGDNRCKVDLTRPEYRADCQIKRVVDQQCFIVSNVLVHNNPAPERWFRHGYIIWNSGNNKNTKIEVRDFTYTNLKYDDEKEEIKETQKDKAETQPKSCNRNYRITLALSPAFDINKGDKFNIIAGCDRRSKTCLQKFNNIINFRGEPDLPGIDKLNRPL